MYTKSAHFCVFQYPAYHRYPAWVCAVCWTFWDARGGWSAGSMNTTKELGPGHDAQQGARRRAGEQVVAAGEQAWERCSAGPAGSGSASALAAVRVRVTIIRVEDDVEGGEDEVRSPHTQVHLEVPTSAPMLSEWTTGPLAVMERETPGTERDNFHQASAERTEGGGGKPCRIVVVVEGGDEGGKRGEKLLTLLDSQGDSLLLNVPREADVVEEGMEVLTFVGDGVEWGTERRDAPQAVVHVVVVSVGEAARDGVGEGARGEVEDSRVVLVAGYGASERSVVLDVEARRPPHDEPGLVVRQDRARPVEFGDVHHHDRGTRRCSGNLVSANPEFVRHACRLCGRGDDDRGALKEPDNPLDLLVVVDERRMGRGGDVVWKDDSGEEAREIPHREAETRLEGTEGEGKQDSKKETTAASVGGLAARPVEPVVVGVATERADVHAGGVGERVTAGRGTLALKDLQNGSGAVVAEGGSSAIIIFVASTRADQADEGRGITRVAVAPPRPPLSRPRRPPPPPFDPPRPAPPSPPCDPADGGG
ncbi:hypothetical protein C8R46DRAFT_1047199 [Mycena filopes]|nr:hypothetical protein C8R46DRAFT_1047199 [Mycena filopes]